MNSRTNPRLLVDTDILSLTIRGDSQLNSRLLQHAQSWAISAVTAVELGRYARVAKSRQIRELTLQLIEESWIIDFDQDAANQAAELMASKEIRQSPIGFADTLIAAHSLSLNVPLVTNNFRHFSRVPGLVLKNWTE